MDLQARQPDGCAERSVTMAKRSLQDAFTSPIVIPSVSALSLQCGPGTVRRGVSGCPEGVHSLPPLQ